MLDPGARPAIAATGPIRAALDELTARDDWLDGYCAALRTHAGAPNFVYDADVFRAEALEADPLRRPALRRHGLGGQTATTLRLATGETVLVTFEHALDAARPGPREIAILDAFRPHLARAALGAARFRLRAAQELVGALAALGLPAAAIDRGLRVLAANPAMQALPGLRIDARDHLSLATPAAQALLSESVLGLAKGEGVRSFPAQMAGDDERARVLILHVQPAPRSGRELFGSADLLVVATSASRDAPASAGVILDGVFDLTPAEARLAAALASGLSLRDAAARCGIRYGSARTCLERIFRKTGTNRQGQLVSILTSTHRFRP